MIDRLVAGRRQPPVVELGPGDDAAVVAARDGRVVMSTDMLVQDRHFRLDWSTPHDVGRKAIAQNAADIAAMGARCTALVVSFGAPTDTPAAQVSALVDGMWDEADRIGAGIVGGDLVRCPQWVVSVTVLGTSRDAHRCGAPAPNPARSWLWPVTWAARRPAMSCGTTGLADSTSYGGAIWCPSRRIGRAWRPPPPGLRP
ncbi:AIR synthase related, N-terminal domain protein [Mycobacterium kansasii 732]|nr:AIR synthase related, N-terminal domain protein [Mycobacterium kansasii 732]